MKRLFIGVPVICKNAEAIVNDWHAICLQNNNSLVWTKSSNWHITLVFLGAYPEEVILQLIPIINEVFDNFKAYYAQLNGVGVFPDKRKPNVLWIGLLCNQTLYQAYVKLIELLQKNNFLFDPKPLKPHLTVARIKYLANRPNINELLDQYKDFNFGPVYIDRITLFESLSTADGVKYVPLYEKMMDIT